MDEYGTGFQNATDCINHWEKTVESLISVEVFLRKSTPFSGVCLLSVARRHL